MKRKIIEIECDVCHKDITNARKRYKFERRNNYLTQFFEPDPPKWTKLDMCERCFRTSTIYKKQNFQTIDRR